MVSSYTLKGVPTTRARVVEEFSLYERKTEKHCFLVFSGNSESSKEIPAGALSLGPIGVGVGASAPISLSTLSLYILSLHKCSSVVKSWILLIKVGIRVLGES